ncbi:MAG TPA: PEP-CTERM sorting domain-containing protein [Terriglobales bacterium]|nr:PEP-CTERM sorting domain-containing protein [Terriglobales bacterium]
MKRIAALLTLVAVLSCITAFANSIPDPRIIIKDPVCGGACTSVGTHFTFSSPNSGSGTLFFTNSSGTSWHSLKLIETGVPASAITCSAPHTFATCSVSTNERGVTTILLAGIGGKFDGILDDHNFSITFGRWPAGGVSFKAIANVPEPTTLALFVTGLGALVSRRKKLLARV